MQAKISFLGAAQNVTGSRFLLEANDKKILIDCGLYQERGLKNRNWEPFPFDPASIDSMLLTHAHVDHSGLIPKLVRDGFRGNIYCNCATAEIVKIILLDSAHLQEEDAAYKKKRHEREKRKGPFPEIPLYTTSDAEASFSHFTGVTTARRSTLVKE
jgi:metallo-beta-lactamase family protein